MQECDLHRIVKEGDNVIKISFELPERAFQGKTGIDPIELMFDPVMIIGDFVLLTGQQKDEYVISPERAELHTGSWKVVKKSTLAFADLTNLQQRKYNR